MPDSDTVDTEVMLTIPKRPSLLTRVWKRLSRSVSKRKSRRLYRSKDR